MHGPLSIREEWNGRVFLAMICVITQTLTARDNPNSWKMSQYVPSTNSVVSHLTRARLRYDYPPGRKIFELELRGRYPDAQIISSVSSCLFTPADPQKSAHLIMAKTANRPRNVSAKHRNQMLITESCHA